MSSEIFKYCPNCATQDISNVQGSEWLCAKCGYQYFQNASAAVGVILLRNDEILLSIRSKEPAIGCYDTPGGFVDQGETAEEAVLREIQEELSLELTHPKYFNSYSNIYLYNGITYHTLDLMYVAHIDPNAEIKVDDDVSGYDFFKPENIPWDKLSFMSVKAVLKDYCKSLNV